MREMPAEPALDAFIARYGLRPSVEEIRQSVTSLKVGVILQHHGQHITFTYYLWSSCAITMIETPWNHSKGSLSRTHFVNLGVWVVQT